jgi:hypothetical protein
MLLFFPEQVSLRSYDAADKGFCGSQQEIMMERATNLDAALPSPSEIEAIDRRRQWGLNFLVISGQFGFFAILLTLWSGQDLTYSPASIHPMFYYNAFCFLLAAGFGLYGSYLRRGQPEF